MEEQSNKLIKIMKISDKFDVIRINPGAVEGVNIPCVLVLPKKMSDEQKITMCFNNEDGTTIEKSAEKVEAQVLDVMNGLNIEGP